MSVTVLLPVYNGEATLAAAIESLLVQDLDDVEILIIDDCSSDGSAALARRYEARWPSVRVVVHARNAGLAATLNEGLESATHDLVARMDQDDESLPCRLRVQRAFLDARPEVVAAGSFVLHMGARPDRDRLVELPSAPREVARRLPAENCLYHPSVMMRRQAVLDAGGYRPEFRNAEDYDLWLRLSRSHDLANVPTPLLRYRFSTNGMTLSRKWEQLFYVHLAQEANRGDGTGLEAAVVRARQAMDELDRRGFMTLVAAGTVAELIRLHLWGDAARLIRSYAGEIGAARAAGLAATIAVHRLRAGGAG